MSAEFDQSTQTRVLSLIHQAKSTIGNSQINAIQELWNLANNDQYKQPLCQPSLNLLSTLRQILESNLGNITICNKVTGVLWYLSRDSTCGKLIASSEINLLPILMRLVYPSETRRNQEYFNQILKLFTNLSLNSFTHHQLLQPDLQWIEFLHEELITIPDDVRSYCMLSNFLLTLKPSSETTLVKLIQLDIPKFIVNKLIELGPNPERWPLRRDGIASWCLSLLTNFSCFPLGIVSLRQLNPLDFLQQLNILDSLEGIKTTIIIANVYGKDESNSYAHALLVGHESILTSLLDLFHFTIHYDQANPIVRKIEATGFQFAELNLRSIVSGLKYLSISDENKKIMIKYLPLLLQYSYDAIDSFVENCEEYAVYVLRAIEKAGGGGQDIETVQHLLELLLQLSFYYDDDTILQSSFRVKGVDLKELLQSVIALPTNRNLPFEARQFASTLLNRLQTTTKKSGEKVERMNLQDVSKPRQHVMLSYSWAKNKHLVIALSNKLKEMGYDVWRDEEGSSLVPSMSGDITETMAAAIMYSYAVIIFVSSEYKESVSCRAEARYARARETSHHLKLIYVMVDENYHSRSPQAVDGWLGFMLGSDLWYPLWKESHIEGTAAVLRDLLGENAKNSFDQSYLKQSSSVTTSLASTAAVAPPSLGELDYMKAWDCLSNPIKVQDPAALSALLEDLGVVDASDFEGVEPQYFESIAILLKPAPQKNFRKALRMI